MHTYRVYMETPSSDDVLSAISGDDEFALELSTTTSFYQSPFGSAVGGTVSPAMITVAPDAAYDSYVTLGATTSADADGGIASVIGGWSDAFEAGNSFVVDDAIGGGWYMAPPGQANAITGDDNRVLVAQLTTDGIVSGQFAAQIFPGGDQENDVRPQFTFQQRPVGAFACPTIDVAPEDETVSCDTEIYLPTGEDFAVSYDFSAADAIGCEGPLTVVDVVDVIDAGNCTGNYTVTRTMEIENCAGQSAFHTYVITVQDITAPVFTSFPADYTVECSDDMPMEGSEASDNCGPCDHRVWSPTPRSPKRWATTPSRARSQRPTIVATPQRRFRPSRSRTPLHLNWSFLRITPWSVLTRCPWRTPSLQTTAVTWFWCSTKTPS